MKKSTRNIALIAILIFASLLRLWKIDQVPVSLFGDELDVGYHAYSVLKTGKDYSGNFLPFHFQSLAEWRTPLYLYTVVPTVALFDISPLGVRLPAAFFGILGVWGMYLLVGEIFSDKKQKESQILALIAAFVMAFSPWHIQYSRAAFEVTQLLVFLIFGLYFFFKSLKEGRYLWLAVGLLTFTPWIYSTAKLFAPVFMLSLFFCWRKDILKLQRKYLVRAMIAGLVIGLPIAYSTLFGGGSQRFGYISVFTDPVRETEIGAVREFDARVRGDIQLGLTPSFSDKLFHNKFVFWGSKVLDNLYTSFSFDFLFVRGDPNLRHSINGMGQFYKIEAIMLLLGLIFFLTSKTDRRIKFLIAAWILLGATPAAITRNGGNHATRLILMLPPLVILISYGILQIVHVKGKSRRIPIILYLVVFIVSFVFYEHDYWIHNPWDSERWWHSGWKEAIQYIKEVDNGYDKVIISMDGEPAWIFFAAWYEYPPSLWHKDFPVGNDVELEGFGKVSHINKFYFGSPQLEGNFYDWGKILKPDILYLANAKEVNVNLIREPERTPSDLKLVKAIPFPSGEPAFYLLSGE